MNREILNDRLRLLDEEIDNRADKLDGQRQMLLVKEKELTKLKRKKEDLLLEIQRLEV